MSRRIKAEREERTERAAIYKENINDRLQKTRASFQFRISCCWESWLYIDDMISLECSFLVPPLLAAHGKSTTTVRSAIRPRNRFYGERREQPAEKIKGPKELAGSEG